MRSAVESGAKWTLGHFLKASGQTRNEYTFESFASWYSSGGYNVAPWLELLDLGKVLSLIADNRGAEELPPLNSSGAFQMAQQKPKYARVSSLRRHHAGRRDPSPEVLFTFPLANRRSLIVLREDAEYVRGVVEQLGLLSKQPGELWIALLQSVERRRNRPVAQELAVYVNRETFVLSMQDICSNDTRKRPAPGSSVHNGSANGEILSNFFQCFDVDQRDSVALDELMGGLMLLCGGKKSAKLAFAFTIFDTRPGIHQHAKKVPHSLSGEDLFLFLRSVLIVTFATCRQSLDMTDDMVGRFITDTANRLCNDVMKHQWETKHMDRINFDEFGQWYNDGGFERAPWLELLDLNKWVLIDNFDKVEKHMAPAPPPEMPLPVDPTIPPPPPEDALDTSFFDENAIMQIDSVSKMPRSLLQFIMSSYHLSRSLHVADGRNGHDINATVDRRRRWHSSDFQVVLLWPVAPPTAATSFSSPPVPKAVASSTREPAQVPFGHKGEAWWLHVIVESVSYSAFPKASGNQRSVPP
jgi:hypothetical protein